MFERFGFKTKLLILCGFLCAVNVLIGTTSFMGLQRVASEYDLVADKALPKVTNLAEMFLQFRDIRINLRSLGLPGVTPEQEREFIEIVKKDIALYEAADADYRKSGFADGEKELYDQLDAAWKTFAAVGKRVLTLQAEQTERARNEMIGVFLKDCPEAAQVYLGAITKLKDFHIDHAAKYVSSAKSESEFSNTLAIFIVIVGALVGLVSGFIFSQSISKSIAQIVSLLKDNAEQVSTAASEIAVASQELSQATTQQASSLEETAAALEELSSMVAKNLDSAKGTAQVSEESKDSAAKGHSTVGQMIVSMGDIRKSNDQISEIVKVIGDIDAKTKVINDIVFQTKLLSFNASVEAARAGEQGRGFAVVAEEVGKLAQMSGNAAKEISGLLSESIHKVESIVHDSKGKVSSGEAWTQECGGILEEIVGNVSRVSTMASEISLASDEQSRGVQEISKAMTELDQVTQKNATTSEKCAVAAEQLSQQSQTLNKTVEQLVHVLSGHKSA